MAKTKKSAKPEGSAKSSEKTQAAPQLDAEVVEKIASLRSHVRESFGKVVMAMMMLPRYRHQTLMDLQHLVLEPLMRDRIAIAQRGGDDPSASDIAGVAIWASLSDEAEGRLRDQIKGGAWPLRLKPDDWNSGQNNWLLDVIAVDQKATAAVIANFRQVVKEGSLKLHPVITRLVDKETLEKMGASQLGGEKADTPSEVPEGETVN
ncbi:toxin-activating lysine-acyltransferase [Aurantiacibacter sp. MUD61]|uniref:toxin-activating lysine-acyltransferase n=1 Tax=Aurantiacibacter sp. MUD61 TaxID=3009083 RepID=UPI0022F03C28|nr:toxin-activating lysine-acyltransferase [Aurantiacibacter sp. MUD61]